jgi:hypothetical protein
MPAVEPAVPEELGNDSADYASEETEEPVEDHGNETEQRSAAERPHST